MKGYYPESGEYEVDAALEGIWDTVNQHAPLPETQPEEKQTHNLEQQ